MSAVIDLTDMRFGRLTVVGLHPERAHWERILRALPDALEVEEEVS